MAVQEESVDDQHGRLTFICKINAQYANSIAHGNSRA